MGKKPEVKFLTDPTTPPPPYLIEQETLSAVNSQNVCNVVTVLSRKLYSKLKGKCRQNVLFALRQQETWSAV